MPFNPPCINEVTAAWPPLAHALARLYRCLAVPEARRLNPDDEAWHCLEACLHSHQESALAGALSLLEALGEARARDQLLSDLEWFRQHRATDHVLLAGLRAAVGRAGLFPQEALGRLTPCGLFGQPSAWRLSLWHGATGHRVHGVTRPRYAHECALALGEHLVSLLREFGVERVQITPNVMPLGWTEVREGLPASPSGGEARGAELSTGRGLPLRH